MRALNVLVFVGMFTWSCQQSTQQQNQNRQGDLDTIQEEIIEKKKIIFFGNSLTAGYGVEPNEAFPALIQDKLDSLGYSYTVVNAGVSGETTASGASRVNWVISRQKPDIFVLELGGNDGLRGINPEETEKNLKNIIDSVRTKYPDTKIILAGMQVPPNMGPDYTREFQKVFPRVAAQKNVTLIPFLLKDVGGEPELNQPDGIHPTPEGHQIVASTVWEYLKPLLEKRAKADSNLSENTDPKRE